MATIKNKGYSFDKDHVKSLSLKDFLKAFEHHKDLPLEDIWNEANLKKVDEKKD